jgi:hypothetical protein
VAQVPAYRVAVQAVPAGNRGQGNLVRQVRVNLPPIGPVTDSAPSAHFIAPFGALCAIGAIRFLGRASKGESELKTLDSTPPKPRSADPESAAENP